MLGTIPESITWLPYFLFGTILIASLVHIIDSRWAKRQPHLVWCGLNIFGLGLTPSLSAELSLNQRRCDLEEMKTPITQEQWRALKPGDGIRDVHGCIWRVTQRDPAHDPDRLFARCPGHDLDRLDWVDGQILKEEWAVIIELNQPGVMIVPS